MKTKTLPHPVGGYILVEKLSTPSETRGGIALPVTFQQSVQAQMAKGRVLATGEGVLASDGKRCPFFVARGDTILYAGGLAIELEHEGEKYILITQEAVFVKLDE